MDSCAVSRYKAYYAYVVMQAPLVGSFFSILFYGISCVQTFFYYQTYPDDNTFLKLLVAIIWILETIQSGFVISFNNAYLIQGFGNVSGLAYINRYICPISLSTSLSSISIGTFWLVTK